MDAEIIKIPYRHDYFGVVEFNGIRVRSIVRRRLQDTFNKDPVEEYPDDLDMFSEVFHNSTNLSFFGINYWEFQDWGF